METHFQGYGKWCLIFRENAASSHPSAAHRGTATGAPATCENPLSLNDRDPKKPRRGGCHARNCGHRKTDENLFIAVHMPRKGILFLKGRATPHVRKISDTASPSELKAASKPADSLTVTLGNKAYAVKFDKNMVIVNGTSYIFQVKEGIDAEAVARTTTLPKAAELPSVSETHFIESPLSGRVVKVQKKAGDKVAVGETVLIIDSMNIETPLNSPYSGIIQSVFILQGDMLETGTALYRVNTIAHGTVDTVARAAEALTAEQKLSDTEAEALTQILSPIAGLVLRIYKEPNETIAAGESLLVMESMKMERPVNSIVSGVIERLAVKRRQIEAVQVLAIVAWTVSREKQKMNRSGLGSGAATMHRASSPCHGRDHFVMVKQSRGKTTRTKTDTDSKAKKERGLPKSVTIPAS